MSIIDDANDRSTLSTSILIPVSSDKTPLSWDGNDATLLGLLHEVGRHYRNKGLFQTLLRDRAVALSNGRLAVEDPNAVYFVSGAISETRSFDDPCPPTVDRITEHNAEVAAGTRTGSAKTVLTAIPDEHKTSIILAKHAVEKEDSTLLHSLSYVFGHAEPSDSILENADGSGLEFLQLLRDRGKRAGPRDKALVSAKFAKIIQEGVKGELTLDTFSAFLKTYKAAKRNIAPASRPPAEAEVEMINIIAVKDPGARELYELKIERTPPGNLDDVSKLLLDMLRGRLRCEEIDQVSSDSQGAALIKGRPQPHSRSIHPSPPRSPPWASSRPASPRSSTPRLSPRWLRPTRARPTRARGRTSPATPTASQASGSRGWRSARAAPTAASISSRTAPTATTRSRRRSASSRRRGARRRRKPPPPRKGR